MRMLLVAAVIAGLAPVAVKPFQPLLSQHHLMVALDSLTWRGGTNGVSTAIAEGDPTRPGPFTMMLKLADGAWLQPHWHNVDKRLYVIRPGSYPGSRAPGHIHFEVAARGFTSRIFEIVFEGDPFVADAMRRNPAFSVRPIQSGRVTDRIVLR